ncbi:MAG TPA: sigma-70 family RNA polymerase sigma factor [Armatimonadota bacterium]|nr:sigma-70 family RNA polymerase sigma factor [Armatimonadota bacterium]
MMNPEPDEYELAMRARDGDRKALADLVERTRMRLFALAYAELHHYEDAQDAVSSALVQICLHIREIQQPEKVRAWMQSIVRNECRRLRRRAPASTVSLEEQDLYAPDDETLPLRLDVEQALRRLPVRHARAMRLFYLEETSIPEIARQTGHPAGTIKYWLHQGRQQLAQLMEGYAPMSNAVVNHQPEPVKPEPGQSPHALIVQTELKPEILTALKAAVAEAGFEPELTETGEISRLAAWSDDGYSVLERWWTEYEMLIFDERIAERPAMELLVNARAGLEGDVMRRRTPAVCLLLSAPPPAAVFASWNLGVDLLVNKENPVEIGRFADYARRLALRRGLAGPQAIWTRFSDQGKAAVIEAQAIAARLGCRAVAPEHSLAALTGMPDAKAAIILRKGGADPAEIRANLDRELVTAAQDPIPVSEVTLSPRMKRAFDFAFAEAWSGNANAIGTEHLLIGVARESGGLAGRTLREAGINSLWLRDEVRRDQYAGWRGAATGTDEKAEKETSASVDPAA